MASSVEKSLHEYTKAHSRRKWWQKVTAGLAAVVVFCTTYALILPAITMEQPVYCGYEEEHTDACYEEVRTLTCTLAQEGHTHSEDCYAEKRELTCGLEETEGHTHTDACYEDRQTRICGLEETEGHTHTEACYEDRQTLICVNEDPEHVHDESCYVTERALICELEECGPHTHDENCYTTEHALICELEECEPHTHDESCYTVTNELICGYTESSEPHEHTDECYTVEKKLICGKELHVHTSQCYSNPEADVETPEIWERTMANVTLTGKWNEDVLAIAASQLGYQESTANYMVDTVGDTEILRGYTRYGDWYSIPYGDWCAMFCAFCLRYAGIDTQTVPTSANCQEWIDLLSDGQYDLCRQPKDYMPEPGDLVFFDWDAREEDEEDEPLYTPEVDPDDKPVADHVGIVAEILENEAGEPYRIRTVEGNSAERVQYCEYDLDDVHIFCYAELPENPDYVDPDELAGDRLIGDDLTGDDLISELPDGDEILSSGLNPMGMNMMGMFPMVGTPAPTPKPIVPGTTSGMTLTASLVDGSHYEIADYFTVFVNDTLDKGNIVLQYSDDGGMNWTNVTATQQSNNKNGNTFTDTGTVNGSSRNRQWRVYSWKTKNGETVENIYGPFNIINLLAAAEPGFDTWLSNVYVEQLGGTLPTSLNGLYDILDYYTYLKELENENPGFTDWLIHEYVQDYGGDSIPLTESGLDDALAVYLGRPELTLTPSADESSVTAVSDPAQTGAQYVWEIYNYDTGKWSYLETDEDGDPVAIPDATISVTDYPEIAGKGIRCRMLDANGNLLNTAQLAFLNPVNGDIAAEIAEINALLGLNAYPVYTEGTRKTPNLSIGGTAFNNYFYYDAVARDSGVPFSDATSYARYLVYVYQSNGGDESARNAVKAVWDKYLYDLYDPNYDMGGKNKGITTVGNYGDPDLTWPKDELSSFHATDGTVANPASVVPLNYNYLENGVDYSNFLQDLDKTATTRNLPTANSERIYDVDISADCQAKVSSPVAMILQIQTAWHLFDMNHADVLSSASSSTENDSAAKDITSLADLYAIKHALLRFVDYMESTYPGNNLVLGVTEVQHGGSSSMFLGTDSAGNTLYVSNNYKALREALLGWDIFGNCEHVHYDTKTLTAALSNLASNLSTWQDFYKTKIEYNDIRKVGVIFGGVTENTNGDNGYGCTLPWSTFQSSKFNSVYGVQVSDGVPRDSAAYTSWLNNPNNNGTPFVDGTGSGFTVKYDALNEDQVFYTLVQIAEREMTAKGLDLKAEDKFVENVTLYDTVQPEFELRDSENIVATVYNKNGTKAYETVISPDHTQATFIVYGTNNAVVSTTPITVVPSTETDASGNTTDVITLKDVSVPYSYAVDGVTYTGTKTCDQMLKLTENDDGPTAVVYDFGTVFNTKTVNLHFALEAKEDYIGSNNVFTNVGTPDADYVHYPIDKNGNKKPLLDENGNPVTDGDGNPVYESECYDIHTEKTPEVNVPIRFETEDGGSTTVLVGTEVDLADLDAFEIVDEAVELLDNYPQINGTMSFEWVMPDGTKIPVDLDIPVVNGQPEGYSSEAALLAAVEAALDESYTPEHEGTYKPRLNVTFEPEPMFNDGNFHNDTKTLKPVPEKTEYGVMTIKAMEGTQDLIVSKVWTPYAPSGTTSVDYVVIRADTKDSDTPLYLYKNGNDWAFTDNIDLAKLTLSETNGWKMTLEDVPTVILDGEDVTILDYTILETTVIPDYTASYHEGTVYDNFAEFKVDLTASGDIEKYVRITYTVNGVQKEYITPQKVKFNNTLNQRKCSVTITLPDHYTSAPVIVVTDAKMLKDDLTLESDGNQKISSYTTNPTVTLTPDPNTGKPTMMIVNIGPVDQTGDPPAPEEGGGITLNKNISPYSVDGVGNIENEFIITLDIDVDLAEYISGLITGTKKNGDALQNFQVGGTSAPAGANKSGHLTLKDSGGNTVFDGNIYWKNEGDICLYLNSVLLTTMKPGDSKTVQMYSDSFLSSFAAAPTGYLSATQTNGTALTYVNFNGTQPTGPSKHQTLTIKGPDGTTLYSDTVYWKPDNQKEITIKLNGTELCTLKDNEPTTVTLLTDGMLKNILNVVEDQMGEYIDYVDDENYPVGDMTSADTPATMYNAATDILTWHPAMRTVSGHGLAQLKYHVRLNTEKAGFNSCADNMSSGATDPESFPGNDHATLYYGTNGQMDFPVPYARGLLYNILIKKTDALTGMPLKGAKFEITCPDNPAAITNAVEGHYIVTTDASGRAKFEDLVALEEGFFPGEFIITEVEAPDGYMITEPPRTVFISNYTHNPGWFVPDGDNMLFPAVQEVIFADSISPTLNLVKVSMESGNPLAGAEFNLYRLGEDDTPELIDWFTSDEDGLITDDLTLDQGTYILEEVKAPDGYQLPAVQFKFTVTPTASVERIEGFAQQTDYDERSNTYYFSISNSSGYKLPKTGGCGTLPYILGGLALMGTSLVYGFSTRRKRGRRYD